MTEPIRPTVVVSAFVEKEGKFLLVFDPRFKFWRVPGGRLEFDEKPENCLRREMTQEELKVPYRLIDFCGFGRDWPFHHIDKERKSRVVLYHHITIQDEPILDPTEAIDSKWLTFAEIKDHPNIEGALTDFFRRFPHISL